MSVSHPRRKTTPRKLSHAIKTDQTDPRNMGMEGGVTAQGSGIEHGCPARLGAFVMDGSGPEGIITGFTDQLVIFTNDKGHEYAQRYGMCSTPLAPPANFTGPVGVVTEPRPLDIPAELLSFWPDDRYRRLQMKATALMLEVEEARADCLELLIDDHDKLIDALEDFQMKASEIDDNRLAAAIQQAREAVQATRSAEAESDTSAA
jgi:hypothetical protein